METKKMTVSETASVKGKPAFAKMLSHDFFRRDPLTCSRELIGCGLVWDNCAGIIVETEAYSTANDEACHTFSRKGSREFVANHEAGAAYIYLNYGMYWLLNVLVKNGAEDGFVLIRALEPTRGFAEMQRRRKLKTKPENPKTLRALCSGPGKLSQAMAVSGADHGADLCSNPKRCFYEKPEPVRIVSDVRIGISKAAHLPWRFLLRESAFVSAQPKTHSTR